MPARIPERTRLEGLEAKWSERWERAGTYRFDASRPRDEVFSIDTPPPTVSGSLHVGHVFSYTQTDVIARYQRMRGKAVFYPIGWDDNGLATERRVQNYYGVRCDPTQPYDPNFEPPAGKAGPQLAISRPNFVELCYRLTTEDERAFEELFRRLGLSFDWRQHYTTIGEKARRASQAAFLRNLERGEAYRAEAPTLWDVDFRTAVAQAELEDREVAGAYHRLGFGLASASGAGPDGRVEIETSRPELVPACVALVAHPSDERYRGLFGRQALTPLFSVRVPIVPHHLAEPAKGTGLAMVCTFGDLTDVTWWRELSLPTRTILGRDGRLGEAPFGAPGWESEDPEAARTAYAALRGKNAEQARRAIVELLEESGALCGEVRQISHPVKFYERGERPLEIVSSPQWYIRTLTMRQRLLALGRDLGWVPPFMRARYENWVEGLTGDWNISRQRYFGVPFPVWYRLGDDGAALEDDLLLPEESRLPVDPSTEVPEGFEEADRGRPGGFVADPDVMDTWATSSLTPQIVGGYFEGDPLFERIFPADVRPQAHDIIRTWLFSTVVRAALEHDRLPWRNAAISGWILDPDRKKMSKSKGNVVVPKEPVETYGADAVRYWAGAARLGVDTAYDDQQLKAGRRLAIKLLNVSRFVLSRTEAGPPSEAPDPLEPLDAALLAALSRLVDDATEAFERYDYARALEQTESFFWQYCDDYVELVKARTYGEVSRGAEASALFALGRSLGVQLRLFAPFLPYASEEAWSWSHEESVHLAPWPSMDEPLSTPDGLPELLGLVAKVLGIARRAKSEAHVSMRSVVRRLTVTAPRGELELIELASGDLRRAGVIEDLVLEAAGEELEVHVELA